MGIFEIGWRGVLKAEGELENVFLFASPFFLFYKYEWLSKYEVKKGSKSQQITAFLSFMGAGKRKAAPMKLSCTSGGN